MSLHPPRVNPGKRAKERRETETLPQEYTPSEDTPIIYEPSVPGPTDRESYLWNGATILKQFARRPRVLRLEASKPRGSVVGE